MTLGSSIKSAVGVGSDELVTVAGTFFKRLPLDSTVLDDSQELWVESGFKVKISNYETQDKHCSFDSTDTRCPGHWYAFLEHVEFRGAEINLQFPSELQLLNKEQLYAIGASAPYARLDKLLQPLNDTMARYKINTPLRKAHFLAQTGHESDGFNTNEEYADGSAYEGRGDLGNTARGDGVRYKGRGLIQITGYANYADCGRDLGIDLISNPELLLGFELACLCAGWYWDTRELNILADRDDIYEITRIVNGGYNGLPDRKAYLERAKTAFGI